MIYVAIFYKSLGRQFKEKHAYIYPCVSGLIIKSKVVRYVESSEQFNILVAKKRKK
jgi:hypothetical protein